MESLNLNYLTADEIISLNSITGGGRLQGIDQRRGMLYFTKERNEKLLHCLEEKKITTDGYRLTRYGIYLTHLIRQYRESDTYCRLNHETIALTEQGRTIIVQPKDKGYVIAEIPRELLLHRIMKAYPSLWEGTEVLDRAEYLFVRKWEKGAEQKHMAYYWNGAGHYMCDMNTKERKAVTGTEIRKALVKLLEMEEEGCQKQRT